MRLRAIALAGILLVALAALAAGAGAAGKATTAACTLKASVTLSPGISRTASAGTVKSTSGTITCRGTVAGASATGAAGGLSISATYGPADTCTSGKGNGTFTATIPTKAGTKTVNGTFKFTRAAVAGVFQGSGSDGAGNSANINGDFSFVPTTGNCATTTVTAANVNGAASLKG